MTHAEVMRAYRVRARGFLDALRVKPCEMPTCPKPKGFPRQLAHIRDTECQGRGRGLERRYLDVKRNPDAYVVACLKCHGLLDAKRRMPGSRQALGLKGTVLCPS